MRKNTMSLKYKNFHYHLMIMKLTVAINMFVFKCILCSPWQQVSYRHILLKMADKDLKVSFLLAFPCLWVRCRKWEWRLFNKLSKIFDVTTGIHVLGSLLAIVEDVGGTIDFEMFYIINEYFVWECSSRAVDIVSKHSVCWYQFECEEFTGSRDYKSLRLWNYAHVSDAFKNCSP